MEKVIPIMPCSNIKEQVNFYEKLGFKVKGIFTSPGSYLILEYNSIELHFYGNKATIPNENPTMCYIQVTDIEEIYTAFTSSLKANLGKIPRSGIPRISKIRDLKGDRRFTLVDEGGNTFYVGMAVEEGESQFLRNLENEELANDFTILYDLVYSKEDYVVSRNMLQKMHGTKHILTGLDKAKLLLVELEIAKKTNNGLNTEEIDLLLEAPTLIDNEEGWSKVKEQYRLILSE